MGEFGEQSGFCAADCRIKPLLSRWELAVSRTLRGKCGIPMVRVRSGRRVDVWAMQATLPRRVA